MDYLTDEEHELIEKLGQCAGDYVAIRRQIDPERLPSHDIGEFVGHIHDLQARIMSRAAARAYPDRYRML